MARTRCRRALPRRSRCAMAWTARCPADGRQAPVREPGGEYLAGLLQAGHLDPPSSPGGQVSCAPSRKCRESSAPRLHLRAPGLAARLPELPLAAPSNRPRPASSQGADRRLAALHEPGGRGREGHNAQCQRRLISAAGEDGPGGRPVAQPSAYTTVTVTLSFWLPGEIGTGAVLPSAAWAAAAKGGKARARTARRC
jgi:hypothetical protein